LKTRLLLALALLVSVLVPLSLGSAADAAPQAADPEIIGGHLADPGEYPFVVALLQRNVADRWSAQFCGGSLIQNNRVLTAAHCMVGRRPNTTDVLAGTNRLATPGGQRIHVTAVHVHPQYNPRTSGNDIAVLELASPAAGPASSIARIEPGHFDLWDPGTTATVMGWGDRNPNPNAGTYPVNLWEVDVPLLSHAQCHAAYGAGYINKKMMCAGDLGNGGEDSCQGDSGGPLIVPDGGSDWVQVGIVSFGVGCGNRRFPGVYTRLVTYTNWVNQFLV
jgi:secreted trypsin-like serine protease